ncbi:MAG: GNAT family N-acetyltransferase [Tannerellaceae bacterium]|jgi:putative acetyltransferase|nr:GNAT family N-acetyltransferase [Tannerellaceae bacterium]
MLKKEITLYEAVIQQANKDDYDKLMLVWESAVKATHDFLKQEDFGFYKKMIPGFFAHVDLYTLHAEKDIVAFMGIAGDNLEMLFVSDERRGLGYGKRLLEYAINILHVTKVDVNEQNKQAIGFYEKYGFKEVSRSEKDSMGKDYPILHMSL